MHPTGRRQRRARIVRFDFVEFLDSKYAERSQPDGLLSKITATVENTMRAGKLPIQAITGTMGLMDSAAKVMKGLAAAGQAVVEEAVKAAEGAPRLEEEKKPKPLSSWRSRGISAEGYLHGRTDPSRSDRDLQPSEFIRGIGPLAAISLVVGSMIGSGIFIVSADIGRQVSSWGPGRCCWSG